MRTPLALVAVLLSGLVQAPSVSTPAPFRSRMDAIAAEIHPAIIEIRRDIHRNPELGFRETRTAALVAARLRALKFDEVRTGVGKTGVVGVLKGGRPGPVVAVRADMDALPVQELNDVPYKSLVPNVKHACGHDGHTSIALGVAEILSRLRADWPGTVVFLFQPAEEGDPDGGPTGARRVLEDWPLQNPTPAAIFGLHVQPELPVGQIGYHSGPAMASADRFTVKIVGKQTHGAMPHTGIDPVPIAAEVVSAFQTIPSRLIDARTPTVLTVATINGGSRFNIVADSVTLTGTVRTLTKDGPSRVKAAMDAILKGATSSRGASYVLDYVETTPVVFNDPALVSASLAALRGVVGDG
ncbi:MAG TPA: amidohydrolase, partial [Vicinamibacterales bacterium]|nr:amidohydrolase [Vicinamibacterales bacterium]